MKRVDMSMVDNGEMCVAKSTVCVVTSGESYGLNRKKDCDW